MRFGKVIISGYDYTGRWSEPYVEAGYDVRRIDIQHGKDVRLLRFLDNPPHGLILQPPCTHFTVSGARWWAEKGDAALLDALALVDAGMRLVALYARYLKWWVLENPVGRLSDYIGPPRHIIHPWEYDGYTADDDNYTKATCLWGEFVLPPPKPGPEPHDRTRIHHVAPGPERANIRSATPTGWARAFYECNK